VFNEYRFNRKGLNECCIATLTGELYRRKEAKEPLLKDGDTLLCECGKRLICEPSRQTGLLRWGLDERLTQ
jgi:hypothetical protein